MLAFTLLVVEVLARDASLTLVAAPLAAIPTACANIIGLVPGRAADVHVPIVAPVGADWEEGVWTMRFLADGREAGAGQFWLARDPSRFDFAAALRKQ